MNARSISQITKLLKLNFFPSNTSHYSTQPKLSSKTHCYKQLFPWKTLSGFANHLSESIVYCKDGVVALNKPYGVLIRRIKNEPTDSAKKQNTYTSLLSSQEDFSFSIEDALPQLKATIGCSELHIVKSAERYSSGIVLMATTKSISERITKSIRRARAQKVPHLVHWIITNGCPVESARKERVGMKMVDIEFREEKQPILVTDFSKSDVKFKRLKTFLVEYRALSISKELSTALLEVAASSTTWHFLRVYASSRVASILGDMLYGSRMRMVLGRPVNINPHNMAAYDKQPLPQVMCQRLQIPPTVDGHEMVPTMLHLRSIILPSLFNKNDVQITVPPPFHFQWTCSQLGLLPEAILSKETCL